MVNFYLGGWPLPLRGFWGKEREREAEKQVFFATHSWVTERDDTSCLGTTQRAKPT